MAQWNVLHQTGNAMSFVPFFLHLTYSGEFFMSVHVNLHAHNCIIFHCVDARIPSSGSVHFAESMLWALIFLWSLPVPYRTLFRTLWFDGEWLETRANPCYQETHGLPEARLSRWNAHKVFQFKTVSQSGQWHLGNCLFRKRVLRYEFIA